jgi:hypothetical protein
MEGLVATAERVRGLRFRAPVTTRVETERAIRQALEENLEDEELQRGRAIYVALGLLPADVDVRALLLGVLGEQVVGYYDHRRDTLVVREDALAALLDVHGVGGARGGGRSRGRGEARGLGRGPQGRPGPGRPGADHDEGGMILVHELVHALQDQALGLGVGADARRTSDASTAFHALVEGDATLAMVAYVAEAAGVRLDELAPRADVLRQAVAAAPPGAGQTQLERAPAIVREPMLAAYLDGMVFVAHLYARGGWRAVDDAHLSRPPATMEQVLHPDRYDRAEPAEPAPLDAWLGDPEASAALRAAGLREGATDTLGELELRIYCAQAAPPAEAARAADGWAGDAVRAYARADGLDAAVWATTWDDEREAAEAAAALERVARALPDGERAEALVARTGRAVLALRRIPLAAHAALARAHGRWASSLPPRWPPAPRP